MAHSCVSTSAASLRLKSPVFSSAKPSSFPSTQTLVVPFEPLRSRKLREIAGNQQHVRKSPLKAIYDGERSSRSGLWSIRDDLEIPASSYFSVSAQGQGPSLMVLERFQSVINQLFQHRIIRCGGPVDDDMANMIVAQLLYLDAVDPGKDIVMYVNSPGGNVTSGMAVFDTMKHIRPDVSTVCAGIAASMAAFLLAAGTKGKRFSLPNARIMIHQPLGALEGYLTEISVQYDEVLHHKANMCSYLAYYTGQSLDKITEDTCYDFFMSAEEAVEYGLIDGVITNPLGALPPLAAGADQ